LSGCGNANPLKAQASVAGQGLDAAATAQVIGALGVSAMAVKTWQSANSRFPTVGEFATIDGAQGSAGPSITYRPTANGFCISATSTTQSKVTRVYREPGGVQPPGSSC
jgi:hypothetical protein